MRSSKRLIRRIVLLSLIVFFVFQAVSLIISINDKILPQVKEMARIEASNAATQIIKRSISTIHIEPSECMSFMRDEDGNIIEVNYHTQIMNQILSDCLMAAQTSLDAASKGHVDPNTKMLYYDGGVIYSVHAGYFTGIALFSKLGPQIELHMEVMNACSGVIEVKNTPYGMNSTLIEIELVLTTQLLVVTPFLMTQAHVECRIPLVILLVQGKLPDYYMD